MHKIIVFLIFSLFTSVAYCQPTSFEIIGKVELIKKSKTIILEIPAKHSLKLISTIKNDGSFAFKGKIDQPKQGTITIASSPIYLWIDKGTITLNLYERKAGNSTILFIRDFKGPEDSYLYFYKQIALNLSLKNATPEQFDSLIKVKSSAFIDSVFLVRPTSKVLPHYIGFYSSFLGAQVTGSFYNRLSAQQQMSEDGIFISNYLQQQSVVKVGESFENFSLPDTEGKLLQLDSIKANLILIDFWASWCGPCRANHPYLRKAYEKYKAKGLSIVSISLDDEKEKWIKAIKKDRMSWLNVSDLKGYEGDIAKRIKLWAVPYSIVIDKYKKIIGLNWAGQDLIDRIDRLLIKHPIDKKPEAH